jgi:hypothetical protein
MTSSYGEGERVFGPPLGVYDADWVAAAVRAEDPAVPVEQAHALALQAWDALREGRAPELPGPHGDLVARVATAWCREYGL